jgi:predicted RNase H-like HicB family nuclease
MQKWIVTLEIDEDGWYIVECPSIPGCVSQGRTEEEALENIKDAITECLKVRADEGLPLSVKTCIVEVAA